METEISSSLALEMGAIAAMAEPPQMAVPAVIRKEALPCDVEELAEQQAEGHGGGDADGGVEKAGAAGMQHLVQVHTEAERNDGELQKEFGERTGFGAVWVCECESEGDASDQRDGR